MNEIVIYQAKDKRTEMEVRSNDDTVWLSQSQMIDLFDSSKTKISVAYRISTQRDIWLRQWATQRLKAFLLKGYTINQKRQDELQQTAQLIAQKETADLFRNEKATRVPCKILCKSLAGKICTRALRRVTDLLYFVMKIIPLLAETNALAHFYLCGFWRRINTVSKKG